MPPFFIGIDYTGLKYKGISGLSVVKEFWIDDNDWFVTHFALL